MAGPETATHDAVPPAQSASLVGQILDGRIRLLRKLGQGGTGEVYAAEHVAIGKRFAIKLLYPEMARNTAAVTRLFQQARSASSIAHRNIVEIMEFGQLAGGRIYFCMELLEGTTLGALTAQPMAVDRLLYILLQAGHGLAAAHAKGIVHRDLKPSNIFVTKSPRREDVSKLLDFGIAEVSGNDGPHDLTRTGTISGTPLYLTPEQVLGQPVDARTDIYALGVIMYECFSGMPPFQGDSDTEILSQHITTEPEPVAQRAATAGRPLPRGLAETITRCLQKDPAQRFQTMDELVAELTGIHRVVVGVGKPATGLGDALDDVLRSRPGRAWTGDTMQRAAGANAEAERAKADASARAKANTEAGRAWTDDIIKGPAKADDDAPGARPDGLERADSRDVIVESPADESAPDQPLALDENVQFTVYRPRAIAPARWYSLLAFAHLAERRPGELDAPDPIEEVHRQAEAVLGERAAAYQSTTQDSGAAIPAEGELVFVVEIPGVEVNPPRRSFLWTEPVHREEFRIRAGAQIAGTTARGRLTVFLGCIVIAELPLAMRVDAAPATAAIEHTQVRPYRKIFASYSHRDRVIVDQFERYARALGDEYLRDSIQLRSGEVWNDRLIQMIDQADAFQLFWSHNSMHSPYVRQEYEHALSLNRPSFVRPTYWEDPMPRAEGLPPEALSRLHFQKLGGLVDDLQPTSEAYSATPATQRRTVSASGPPDVPTTGPTSEADTKGIEAVEIPGPPLDVSPLEHSLRHEDPRRYPIWLVLAALALLAVIVCVVLRWIL